MRKLTILYDAACPLCLRCRGWMEGQPSYVELEFLSAGGLEANRRFGGLPWLGEELVVVSDEGEAWVGPAAFLICLWALVEWREWSYRLSGPTFAPMAERFFHAFSSRRRRLAAWLGLRECPSGGCGVGAYR